MTRETFIENNFYITAIDEIGMTVTGYIFSKLNKDMKFYITLPFDVVDKDVLERHLTNHR